MDSVDEDLMIIITHPPRLGTLRMDDGSPDGRYLSEGDVFEMRQLWENRVIYKRGEGQSPPYFFRIAKAV